MTDPTAAPRFTRTPRDVADLARPAPGLEGRTGRVITTVLFAGAVVGAILVSILPQLGCAARAPGARTPAASPVGAASRTDREPASRANARPVSPAPASSLIADRLFWGGPHGNLALRIAAKFTSAAALQRALDLGGSVGVFRGRSWTLGRILVDSDLNAGGHVASWRVSGPAPLLRAYAAQLRQHARKAKPTPRSVIYDLHIRPIRVHTSGHREGDEATSPTSPRAPSTVAQRGYQTYFAKYAEPCGRSVLAISRRPQGPFIMVQPVGANRPTRLLAYHALIDAKLLVRGRLSATKVDDKHCGAYPRFEISAFAPWGRVERWFSPGAQDAQLHCYTENLPRDRFVRSDFAGTACRLLDTDRCTRAPPGRTCRAGTVAQTAADGQRYCCPFYRQRASR